MGLEVSGGEPADNEINGKIEGITEDVDSQTRSERSVDGIEGDLTLPPQPKSLATTSKGKKAEAMLRDAISEKDFRWITEDIDIDLLDPDYVASKKSEIFKKYGTTEAEYLEECRKTYENDSQGKFNCKLTNELVKFECNIDKANEIIFWYCYTGEILNSTDLEERMMNIFHSRAGNAVISKVINYLNDPKVRNDETDSEIIRAIYNAEMSTSQPFPLSDFDRANYFAGQIYTALAIATGNWIRDAIYCFNICSPDAFCTDKYTGMFLGKDVGKRYEDVTGYMIEKCEAVLPRWIIFGAIKDPVMKKLVKATKLFKGEQFERALDAYKDLFDYAFEKSDSCISDHAAIMCARCISAIEKSRPFREFDPEDNILITNWLAKSGQRYAYTLRQGLIERAKQIQEN